MIRAVIDTNTIISAVISPKGAPRRVYEAWLMQKFTLVTSPLIIAEIIKVLNYARIKRTYRLADDDMGTVVALLWTQAEVTPGVLTVSGVASHQEDDKLVSCAVEGRAHFIVTGDKAFQALGHLEAIRIVAPKVFIELLESPDEARFPP